jgi:hypothetical protein
MERFDKAYLSDVSECQANLFVMAADEQYSMTNFIRFYLNSDLRQWIDDGHAVYCCWLAAELMKHLKENEDLDKKVKKTKRSFNPYAAEWIGYFYSYMQWYTSLYSSELMSIVPVSEIIQKYNILHNYDIKHVLQMLLKTKGININIEE